MPLTFPRLTRRTQTVFDVVDEVNAVHDALATITSQAHNVRESTYGATGNGVADDSAAIQAAIDAVSVAGGGVAAVPPGTYRCNVVLKEGVFLVGAGAEGGFGYLPGAINQTKLVAAGAGAVVDTPATNIKSAGVVGINVQGLGAGTAVKGIRFRDVDYGTIKNVGVHSVADEGILLESPCTACHLEGILVTQAVLNRSRAATIGAIDVHGTDHWVDRIEAGISGSIEGTVQSASLYCVAVAWRASTSWVRGIGAELSDIGMYVSGSYNLFSGCRADLNYGHGWILDGSVNRLDHCFGLDNSQDTTNTYSNFRNEATALFNVYAGCVAWDLLTKKAKYGFEDLVSTGNGKSQYLGCLSTTAVTQQFLNQASNGSGFVFPSGGFKTLTADSATPAVIGYGQFRTANTVPTTITDFTGGVNGQEITVWCNDANTTVQHNGSTIILDGAGNLKLRSGQTYAFAKVSSGAWREVRSALPLGVTADVGNLAKTLQARVNEETQIWATALTADRAVTLSTTGAYAGARFRIVRAASATGAFNLNVGAGPLKALATNSTWCDVEYNGSAWVLTGAGSL